MKPALKLTDQRREALETIGTGVVTYDLRTATWTVDGSAVSGWPSRTFEELKRAGLVAVGVPDSERVCQVRLTQVAWERLSN